MKIKKKQPPKSIRNPKIYADALYVAHRLGYATVYTLAAYFHRANPAASIDSCESKARRVLKNAETLGWLKEKKIEHIGCFALTATGAKKANDELKLPKPATATLDTLRFKRAYTDEDVKRCRHRIAADLTALVFLKGLKQTFFERECLQNRDVIKNDFCLHKIPDGLLFNADKSAGIFIEVDKSRRALVDWAALFNAIRLNTSNSEMAIPAVLMICSKETKASAVNHLSKEFVIKDHLQFDDYEVLRFDSESIGENSVTWNTNGIPGLAHVILIEIDFKQILDWSAALNDAKNGGVGKLIEELLAVE